MDNLFRVPLLKELASFQEDINADRKISSSISGKIDQSVKRINKLLHDHKLRLTEIEEDALTEDNLNMKLNELNVLNKTLITEEQNCLKLNSNINVFEAINDNLKEKIMTYKTETAKFQENLDSLKNAQKDAKNAIIDKHRTYLFFNHLYKTYSGCKVHLKTSNIVRVEFSPDIYVELQSEDWKFNWKILDCKPDINNMNEIKHKLYETGDIQAFLACIYNHFSRIG